MINVVELDERINKCLSVLQENPRSRIFAALAEAYRRRGDVGRAFSVCKNGLRIHPDYGAAHVVMAKLYLHQSMLDQARESILRAVELDGPSRSTDLVLAEIHLEAGEFKAVREILDRLNQVGGVDPTVQQLRAQLRYRAQRGEPVVPGPGVTPLPVGEPAAKPASKTLPAREAIVPDTHVLCDSPAAVIDRILSVPRTAGCALWKDDGTLLAARGTLGSDLAEITAETWTLYADIQTQVAGRGWGHVVSIRIEEPRGQWGMFKDRGMIALIVGTPNLALAAVVRKALDCLHQLAAREESGFAAEQAFPGPGAQSPV